MQKRLCISFRSRKENERSKKDQRETQREQEINYLHSPYIIYIIIHTYAYTRMENEGK